MKLVEMSSKERKEGWERFNWALGTSEVPDNKGLVLELDEETQKLASELAREVANFASELSDIKLGLSGDKAVLVSILTTVCKRVETNDKVVIKLGSDFATVSNSAFLDDANDVKELALRIYYTVISLLAMLDDMAERYDFARKLIVMIRNRIDEALSTEKPTQLYL